MNKDEYDLQGFDRRMNEWIASQGFMFGLMNGSSFSFGRFIVGLLIRLAILLLIVGLIIIWYTGRKVNREDFRIGIQNRVIHALGAESGELKSFSRFEGKASMKSLRLEGGDESFFHSAHLPSVICKMPLWSLLPKQIWHAGGVKASSAFFALKAGAQSDEMARANWSKLFIDLDSFAFDSIELPKFIATWGYSEPTRGVLFESNVTLIKLSKDEWSLKATGGQFSQAWITGAKLNTLSASLYRDKGIVIHSAALSLPNGGEIEFNASITVAASPEVQGRFTAKNVHLEGFLPEDLDGGIAGVVDFEGSITGSPNKRSGIITNAKCTLADKHMVDARSSMALVSLLKVMDGERRYEKVRFGKGSFTIYHDSQVTRLSEISLIAEEADKMPDDLETQAILLPGESLIVEERPKVTGDLEIRNPTQEETAELLGVDENKVQDAALTIVPEVFNPAAVRWGLTPVKKRTNQVSRQLIGSTEENSFSADAQQIKSLLNRKRIFGAMTLLLHKEGFSTVPFLLKKYQLVEETGEIIVPLEFNDELDEASATAARRLREEIEDGVKN